MKEKIMVKKEEFTWFERLLRNYGKHILEESDAFSWDHWTLEERKNFLKNFQ
jgi:hypothetical protein